MKQATCCGNCARGIKMNVNKDILCRIKGAVSRDYVCTKYQRMNEVWTPSERKPKCIECEFFINSESGNVKDPSIGFCQLFTVRYYNGEIKSACSKFCRKTERNIS
jgi:hypothetical protein